MSATASRLAASSPWRTAMSAALRNGCAARATPQPTSAILSAAASRFVPLQLVLERSDRALRIVLLHRQPDRLRLQALNLVAPSFRWRWQAFERRALAFRLTQRREMRKGAELALDFIFARAPLAQALGRGGVSISRNVALSHKLGIGRGKRIGLLALMLQRLELTLQFGKLGCRCARPVELFRPLAQRVRAYR